jgi:hypothetical protein
MKDRICPNRPTHQEVSLAACRWHVFGGYGKEADPICLEKIGELYGCPVTRQLKEEEEYENRFKKTRP